MKYSDWERNFEIEISYKRRTRELKVEITWLIFIWIKAVTYDIILLAVIIHNLINVWRNLDVEIPNVPDKYTSN